MAQPLKLTPELVVEISKFVAVGSYVSVACQAVGISPATYYRWLDTADKSKDDDEATAVYREFRDALKKAEAQAETMRVALIAKASIETWTAAAWLLERKYPERWGRRMVVSNEDAARPFAEKTDAELRAIVETESDDESFGEDGVKGAGETGDAA